MLKTPLDTDWDRFWGLENSKHFGKISWSKQRVLQVLKPLCGSEKSALDAGCGSGFFSRFFQDQGMNVTALDYSEKALEMAQIATDGRAKLVQCDLVNDILPGIVQQRYDVIFTDGLFEHFSREDQDRIMENLLCVIKKGGVIVTVVPNRWSPWELIRPFYMPGIQEEPFVLSQLIDLNQRNKMTVVRKGGVNVFPWRISPEFLGPQFGMLLFTVATY